MLFDFDLVIPAHTLQSDPMEQIINLTRGNLVEIRVMFPPGPATLVHVVVRDRLHQLMPANQDGTLNFDEQIISSRLSHEMRDAPYELRILGWSPNAVYDHIITCQFDMEPGRGDNWDDFNRVLFALNSQTEKRR